MVFKNMQTNKQTNKKSGTTQSVYTKQMLSTCQLAAFITLHNFVI